MKKDGTMTQSWILEKYHPQKQYAGISKAVCTPCGKNKEDRKVKELGEKEKPNIRIACDCRGRVTQWGPRRL